MDFIDEIKNYTDDELDLIISTQKDLYAKEEMEQLKALYAERMRIKKEEHEAKILARLPETITCEKCEGPNPFSNTVCEYCGHKFDKSKYYTDEYYERKEQKEADQGSSYIFHYIISLLFPIIGFIIGVAMLASSKNAKKMSVGASCIVISIVSCLASGLLTLLLLWKTSFI